MVASTLAGLGMNVVQCNNTIAVSMVGTNARAEEKSEEDGQ
jgi:hypothetical protein